MATITFFKIRIISLIGNFSFITISTKFTHCSKNVSFILTLVSDIGTTFTDI